MSSLNNRSHVTIRSVNTVQDGLRRVLEQAKIERQQQQRWRQLRVSCESMLDFSSNDYLGLRHHPAVLQAYTEALQHYGAGSGGSPLVSGYQAPHRYLADQLADWLAREAVVLFNSGFAANHSVLRCLGPHYQQLLLDRLAHASLLDGAQASGSRWRRFGHNDTEAAGRYAERHAETLVISESVFSMDGDRAPIGLLRQHCPVAALWIDDAHGIGVLGTDGRSCAGEFAAPQVDYLTLTFGKAFGVGGAAFACSQAVAEYLHNFSRELIYSTAFSAAQAVAISASLRIIQSNEGHQLRAQLAANRGYFAELCQRYGLPLTVQPAAIQTVIVGADQQALALSQWLYSQGLDCRAIRPPTVAEGQARLRIVLSARHQPQHLEHLVQALATGFERCSMRANEPHHD